MNDRLKAICLRRQFSDLFGIPECYLDVTLIEDSATIESDYSIGEAPSEAPKRLADYALEFLDVEILTVLTGSFLAELFLTVKSTENEPTAE